MISTDDSAFAIRISPDGAARLCAAAGIAPPEWEDREWAEVDVRRQTQALTGQDLDEIIIEDDIVGRRPFRCSICDGTFTIVEFDDLRRTARKGHRPRPFDVAEPIHKECRPAT